MAKWQVTSFSEPRNHTRFLECEAWGTRLVTVNQSGEEVHSTDWNRARWATPIAQLLHTLNQHGVALDDDVNSLAGTHMVSLVAGRKPERPCDSIIIRVWKREDAPLYVWQATYVMNNAMTMTSNVSTGHGISQFALEDALEAVGRGLESVYVFIPESQAEEV